MIEYLQQLSLFPLLLTLCTFQFGIWLQKKTGSPLCSPVLISAILVICILLVSKYPVADYQAGVKGISWLLSPATVCLALPLYQQLKILKKSLPAVIVGVTSGTFTSLAVIIAMCHLLQLDHQLSVSLLPKSITTAMGMVLSGQNGGIEALTAVVIFITGIFGALIGSGLCKLFRISDPIAQGVAFGTASHVMGTSRANEIDPLIGAVSSLSLACAGIITAVVFPLVCMLLPK